MTGIALLFAAAALTVKQDGAELREACEPGEPIVAKLAAGTPATVRFGMNGCYAVEVLQAGQTVKGFLPAAAISGIEAWETDRRSARSIDAPTTPITQEKLDGKSPWDLIRMNRPAEA